MQKKWLTDFERACDAVNDADAFKLRCIRLLMKPASEGELFLRVDRSANYAEFRDNFLKTFGYDYTMAEIISQLKANVYVPGKISIIGYILQMQEIAARAEVDEAQTVKLILDGFQDSSSSIAILYYAQTIEQLKQLSRRYAELRAKSSAVTKSSATSRVSAAEADKIGIRCFNCSKYGHYASSCTAQKRAKGSCFRCGSLQHMLKDCTQQPVTSSELVGTTDHKVEPENNNHCFLPIFNKQN
jgi:hypothetical protein